MTKRFIKNEKTGRLVDADGVVGKKIIKDLKEKGKTIEYVEKPKKEKKVETPAQEEPPVRPPDPPTIFPDFCFWVFFHDSCISFYLRSPGNPLNLLHTLLGSK